MNSPTHIPGISRWPDLSNEYRKEWRRLMSSCPQGCDAQKLVSRFTTAVRERNALVAIPQSKR